MLIPDELRKCVVFIGYRPNGEEPIFRATAFFVCRLIEASKGRGWFYLVTAKHVLQQIENQEGFDGKVYLRVNFKDGTAKTVSTNLDEWKVHPDETEVDVAVLPNVGTFNSVADIQSMPLDAFLNDSVTDEHEIGLGDEVFMPGLFYNHQGSARNIPIVRVGNISATPEEKIKTKMGFIDAYLVEARSIGGLSGSPVFVTLPKIYPKGSILTGTGSRGRISFRLLGLIHGHYDAPLLNEDVIAQDVRTHTGEVVNMGIAIVIPAKKILEVIDQPSIRESEFEHEKQLSESFKVKIVDEPDG